MVRHHVCVFTLRRKGVLKVTQLTVMGAEVGPGRAFRAVPLPMPDSCVLSPHTWLASPVQSSLIAGAPSGPLACTGGEGRGRVLWPFAD